MTGIDYEIITKRFENLEKKIDGVATDCNIVMDMVENLDSKINRLLAKSYNTYSERKDDCITEIGTMIEYILKIKYCTNVMCNGMGVEFPINIKNEGIWKNTFESHRRIFSGYVKWGTEKPMRRLIRYTSEHIDDCYEYGVVLYLKACKMSSWDDPAFVFDRIPDKCPWTLKELMDEDIYSLLYKIKEED